MDSIIEKLRDDSLYYGEFGQQYLSNSKIKTLLENPREFHAKTETSIPMVEGRYLHTAVIERHKLDSFVVVDASSRRTNIYKDAAAGSSEPLLLRHEREALDRLAGEIERLFGDEIHAEGNLFEEPGIKEIGGVMWKGKADIIVPGKKIIDIKTTADITKFKRSAYNYNYDSQAYLYREIFGLPMEFYVVCKNRGIMQRYTCSENFYESGLEKASHAINQYNKFFGPDAWEDVNEYVPEIML